MHGIHQISMDVTGVSIFSTGRPWQPEVLSSSQLSELETVQVTAQLVRGAFLKQI